MAGAGDPGRAPYGESDRHMKGVCEKCRQVTDVVLVTSGPLAGLKVCGGCEREAKNA